MKKVFKKSLSLLLAVSALCILFAFQASALTTNCPYCGAQCSYDPMPFDHRHECICPNHGAFTEEDCEEAYCTDCLNRYCDGCGNDISYSSHIKGCLITYNTSYHYYSCTRCDQLIQESHDIVLINGVWQCSCGYIANSK